MIGYRFKLLTISAVLAAILAIVMTFSQSGVEQKAASSIDQCFKRASVKHQLNERYLRAIAWVESKIDPAKTNINSNGSFDIGLMQINSIHLPRLAKMGIDQEMLQDGCINIEVGAQIYAAKVAKHGDTMRAIAAYHSENKSHHPAYLQRIKYALAQIPEDDL